MLLWQTTKHICSGEELIGPSITIIVNNQTADNTLRKQELSLNNRVHLIFECKLLN